MEKNVIEGAGVTGLQVEFNMFNIYKLMELRDEYERAKKDERRHDELAKLGFDKMTDKERIEFNKLRLVPCIDAIEKTRILLNNILNEFKEEADDMFTETVAVEPQAPIGTRENPRMFEDTTGCLLG